MIFFRDEGAPKNGPGAKKLEPLHADALGGEVFDGAVMDDVETGISRQRCRLDLVFERGGID